MFVKELINEGPKFTSSNLENIEEYANKFTYGFEAEFITSGSLTDELSFNLNNFDTILDFQKGLKFYLGQRLVNPLSASISLYIRRNNIAKDHRYLDPQYLKDFFQEEYEKLRGRIGLDFNVDGNMIHVRYKKEIGEKTNEIIEELERQLPSNYNIETEDLDNYDEDEEYPLEIISNVYDNFDNFLNDLMYTLNFIQDSGRTNESCGLHINIGMKQGYENIDPLKVSLLLGDEYLLKMFGRKGNYHARTIKKEITDTIADEIEIEYSKDYIENNIDTILRPRNLFNLLINRKNKIPPKGTSVSSRGDRIEFRITGNKDYEYNFNKIEKLIKRYIFIMNISSDQDLYKKEYLKKLVKNININDIKKELKYSSIKNIQFN